MRNLTIDSPRKANKTRKHEVHKDTLNIITILSRQNTTDMNKQT